MFLHRHVWNLPSPQLFVLNRNTPILHATTFSTSSTTSGATRRNRLPVSSSSRLQAFRRVTTMPESCSIESLTRQLLPSTRLAQPPHHSTFPDLTAKISDLQIHPTIEAALHIVNSDLPSAHFLVRHMQAPPAVEGMLLHGILHRTEGDFDNSRAWVNDVKDACEGFQPKKKSSNQKLDADVFEQTKGGAGSNKTFVEFVYGEAHPDRLIAEVEAFRKKKPSQRAEGEEEDLEARSREEMQKVLEWCKAKFGTELWRDATQAWVKNSEEISKISGDMVSGGKGHREF